MSITNWKIMENGEKIFTCVTPSQICCNMVELKKHLGFPTKQQSWIHTKASLEMDKVLEWLFLLIKII